MWNKKVTLSRLYARRDKLSAKSGNMNLLRKINRQIHNLESTL